MQLTADTEWGPLLDSHPIFARYDDAGLPTSLPTDELSSRTVDQYRGVNNPQKGGLNLGGRRSTMVLKDADLIVAVGREIRMTSLSDSWKAQEGRKAYKARLHAMFSTEP
jgi:nucleoporin NUP82